MAVPAAPISASTMTVYQTRNRHTKCKMKRNGSPGSGGRLCVETEVRDINGLQRFWNEGRSEFSVVVGSIGNTLTQTSTPGMHKRNT
jgi:hypothetical protein